MATRVTLKDAFAILKNADVDSDIDTDSYLKAFDIAVNNLEACERVVNKMMDERDKSVHNSERYRAIDDCLTIIQEIMEGVKID